MKIAIVSEHASPLALLGGVDSGGQNVYVAHVARQLAAQGHTVDVFTRRDHPLQPIVFQWCEKVRVIHVPAGAPEFIPKEKLLPHMAAFGSFLADFCARERRPYDVVHANFFMSGWAALQAIERVHIPLVMTFHALGRVRRLHQREADGFSDERFLIEDRLMREADRVLAECPQDRNDMLDLYEGDPERIDVVPCGFDPEEFSPMERGAARRRLRWPEDEFIVLQLGRMVPRKGVDNVIRGIGALKREHGLRALLYIVGGNSDEPDFEATPELRRLSSIAREEQVENQVRFVGRRGRQALSTFYGACDVFATTPWYEPFGITPIEAMACERPVIGSAVGGIQYTVADGRTGCLVRPNDPSALAAKLALLRSKPLVAQRMGAAGLARARRLFTWSRVAQSVAKSYRRAITPGRIVLEAPRASGLSS
jgi:D-inositol-3-phosphate glycosyltransferase